jgi:CRP/FNR family transcriptional regulator, dissimilatory nitrate respiration regulator
VAQSLAEAVVQAPLFADLSPAQLDGLLMSATVERCDKGAQLFAAGEPAASFLLVVEGSVKVYLLSPDGREHILHMAGAGSLVAEGAVFAQGTYPAYAEALEESRIARFYRDRLVALLQADPELSLAMIAGLSRRLRQFVVTIEDLSLRDVTARLARYLVENAAGGYCRLPGTKTQLAAQLGTVLEPLSRALRKLKDAGLVREHKDGLAIVDAQGLRVLFEGI